MSESGGLDFQFKPNINGYIDDDQYGFRMHHSTEDAIVTFVDTIEKGLGENIHVVSFSVVATIKSL
jgi:hypothetical protein